MKNTTVFDCTLLHFPINHKDNGNITALNNNNEIPFDIKRVYYLYDVPGGVERGGHAHKQLQQVIIAASGSFDLTIEDGTSKRTFNLNRPYKGVLMPSGLWRELSNFSSGSICLVMASTEYEEEDYIRDFEQFLKYKGI